MWYSRAWVRTKGFAKEEEMGGKTVMQGTLVAPKGWPILTAMVNNALKTGILLKDTANTAISAHGMCHLLKSQPTHGCDVRRHT
jgi:carotenoid cleavage dioxygenase-like enzyme